jgi:hypothetical protein
MTSSQQQIANSESKRVILMVAEAQIPTNRLKRSRMDRPRMVAGRETDAEFYCFCAKQSQFRESKDGRKRLFHRGL